MKHWSISVLIIVALSIIGCGGGGSSDSSASSEEVKNQPPVAIDDVYSTDEDTTLTIAAPGVLLNDNDPEGNSLSTVEVSGPTHGTLTLNDDGSFIYIPESDFNGTDSFTYKANDGLADSNVATVTITVRSLSVTLTKGQAQAVLYTAYAGIGYMSAVSYEDDDEALYNVMLDDLNSLPEGLVLDTIFGDDDCFNKLPKLINPFIDSVTFIYEPPEFRALLYVDPGVKNIFTGRYPFTGVLSVDFNTNGYQDYYYGGATYYGDDGSYDIVVIVTGYYKATLLPPALEELFFKSVDIVAKDSLVASYPFGDVTYDEWKISYEVNYGQNDPDDPQADPVNVKLVPDIFGFVQGDIDFRDYTLGGSFSVDEDTYTFGDGFHYTKQESGNPPQEEVFVEGTLSVPGMDGSVSIYIPDPVENNTIIRTSNGIWTSGKMSITSANSVDAVFDNGTANFSGDLGLWTVPNWQDDLDPIGGP